MLAFNSYIDHFVKIWESGTDSLPLFKRSYSKREQKEKEGLFSKFEEKATSYQKGKDLRKLRESEPGTIFFPLFHSFLRDIFDFEPDQLEIILSEEFKFVSRDFFYKARQFAPELSPENIYQAMRNAWIMNSIQLMMNLPVEITPSVFAYSMIYPYSDNLLDNPEITSEEKQEFSHRFNQRLHGEKPHPNNHTESQLFRLVEMFEEQYPRHSFPEVYDSLYIIQQAQTRSLKLIHCDDINDITVREICFEKGGASVLADGYLVAGHLTPVQEQAIFGYGIYLQLLDDLQDMKEDQEAHTRTMLSCLTGVAHLEAFVNRAIHFGRQALDELRFFNGCNMDALLRLMNHSVEMMIVESVGLNPEFYTSEYLATLEIFSPLRFEFIRQKRNQSGSQRFAFFKKYFDQIPSSANFQKSSTMI
ncbi:MAG: hypothetical protein WCY58_03185 [Mariniphaga sp.]